MEPKKKHLKNRLPRRKVAKIDFLKEFKDLKKKFPADQTLAIGNENCDYTDNCFRSVNCYYVFNSAEMEECLHVADGYREVNDVDCDFAVASEGNCECTDFAESNSCYWCRFVTRCYNLWYSHFCVDCHDCFGCTNLTNKAYCIFNIQHTKEEYEKKLPELKKLPRREVLKRLNENIKKFPQLHSDSFNNENSEYCDYTYNSKNCYYCYDTSLNQDCGYLTTSFECKDVWDANYAIRVEQSAEIGDSADSYNCYMIRDSARCYDSYFLDYCEDCHNCFGCVKLSHKQYCILNTQYTKEEYQKKLAEIKDQLGLHYKKPTTL